MGVIPIPASVNAAAWVFASAVDPRYAGSFTGLTALTRYRVQVFDVGVKVYDWTMLRSDWLQPVTLKVCQAPET